MVISSYISLPMWIIAAGFCLSLFITSSIYFIISKKSFSVLAESIKRTPFETIPFVLSMFIIVLALQNSGITTLIAEKLSEGNTTFTFGATSFLASNLINNIPMSVLFSSVVAPGGTASVPALYAAVIGSNIGAFFTPLGALAGIMWMALLRQYHVKLSFGRFVLYGAAISIPTIFASLFGLWLVLL